MTRSLPVVAPLALLALLAPAGRASAAPPPPAGLEVRDGDGWRSDPRFAVAWTAEESEPPVVAAHHVIRSEDGAVASGPIESGLAPGRHMIELSVPPVSGLYEAAVWLEDATGAEGPPATVKLRFDRGRPGASWALPPSGWISANEVPHTVRIAHPDGAAPLSGIRGYAVSVDRDPEGSPCAASDRCSDAETDLRGGIDDDSLTIADLPEGRSFVHAVAVSGSGMRSAIPRHTPLWVDTVDPLTRLSGAPAGWTDAPVFVEADAIDLGSGMVGTGDATPFTAIRIDGGAPIVGAGRSTSALVIGDGIHTVAFYARDAAGNVNDGGSTNGHANAPPSEVVVRIDSDPPTVAFVGSPDPVQPELIEARVGDALSGPDTSRGEISVRAAGSGEPFRALSTEGRGGTLRARWPSEEYPEGEYEFQVMGYDMAGNRSATTERLNGSTMVLPSPLKARTRLVAVLGPKSTVPLGRSATVQGRLSASSDVSLSGRRIRVVERFGPGASLRSRTTVIETDHRGRFRLRLEPGPSREVRAAFAGTAATTGAVSPPLELGVRSRVGLRVSAPLARVGGRPVSFRGHVACSRAEISPDGVTVQLQFRAPGVEWTEFRTLRTDRRCRFHYSYRFSDDDSRGVRFRFRAVVPTQSDWPYEPGGSRPVAVRGA